MPRALTFTEHPALFLDDTWIEMTDAVERVWHQPRKHANAVIEADREWEYHCPVAYGSVMHWRGRFHAWYTTWTRHTPMKLCYAFSDDGVRFHKPSLGLHEYKGSTANNIIMVGDDGQGIIDCVTVIDDADDDKWPLKMLAWDSTPIADRTPAYGIWAARSKDGIHWDRMGQVLPGYGDRFNALPVKRDGKYVAFLRPPRELNVVNGVSPGVRAVWRTESRDLKRWTKPKFAFACDVEDHASMQSYSLVPFEYGGLMLSGIERMHTIPDVLDTELAWSHDAGVTWQRSRERGAFLPRGGQGQFDSHWINLAAGQPIMQGNTMWFYYSGRTAAHRCVEPHNHGAIGLATLRRDGFASIHAADRFGWFMTRPIAWSDADLLVNFDSRRDLNSHPMEGVCGSMRVEVRTSDHAQIDGFRFNDCDELAGNTERYNLASAPVTWKKKSLRKLKGKTVRLLLRMRDTHVYSLRAGDAKDHPLRY